MHILLCDILISFTVGIMKSLMYKDRGWDIALMNNLFSSGQYKSYKIMLFLGVRDFIDCSYCEVFLCLLFL
jgi:hypothetical protein